MPNLSPVSSFWIRASAGERGLSRPSSYRAPPPSLLQPTREQLSLSEQQLLVVPVCRHKQKLVVILPITGVLIGLAHPGPGSVVTDWRMEAQVLVPVGKVTASIRFTGGWLLAPGGQVPP